MSYSDIVIKYNELVKFINNHTRSALDITNENKYWLYCIETDTKILPTFVQKLATVFVEKWKLYANLGRNKERTRC